MADVFTKRCACNRILKLRQSCPVCTERKRAEMHARDPYLALGIKLPKVNAGKAFAEALYEAQRRDGLKVSKGLARAAKYEPPPLEGFTMDEPFGTNPTDELGLMVSEQYECVYR